MQPMERRPSLSSELTRRLETMIMDGDWKPGDTMPNEIELAREYGLSAGTVRKALDWMEDVRLISRQQGRGTFVKGPSAEDLGLRFNKIRTVDGVPFSIEVETLESTEGSADPAEAEHLALTVGAPVMHLTRLQTSSGAPLLLETITVSAEMFPSLRDAHAGYDLAELCLRHGVLIGSGEERLTMQIADERICKQLKIAKGSPVARLERLIRTIDGRPAEWRQAWCNLDGHYYTAELH